MFSFLNSRSRQALAIGLILSVAAIVVVNNFFHYPRKGQPLVTPSESTTRFIGPLDENGDVDYLAVINDHFGKIAPEDNVLVGLLDAIGPNPEGVPLLPGIYRLLKSQPPRSVVFKPFSTWKNIYIANSASLEVDSTLWDDQFLFATKHPWDAEQIPPVDAYITAMKPAMKIIDEAMDRERYYFPLVSDDPSGAVIGALLPVVQQQNKVARLYSCLAMNQIANGDSKGALESAIKIRKIAKVTGQGATLVDRVIGTAIERMAIDIEQHAIYRRQLTQQDVDDHMESIKDLINTCNGIEAYQYTEPAMILDLATRLGRCDTTFAEFNASWGRGTANRSVVFQEKMAAGSINWKHLMEKVNLWFSKLEEAASIEKTNERLAQIRKLQQQIAGDSDDQAQAPSATNAIFTSRTNRADIYFSKLFTTVGWIGFLNCEQSFADTEARNAQTEVLAALVAYERANNAYPESLEQLVPEYLAAIPVDPFNGNPMPYLVANDLDDRPFILYSVGINEKDENGVGAGEAIIWKPLSGQPDDISFPRKPITMEEYLKDKQ